MRRLSVTGIKNPTKDRLDTTPKHQYSGQDGAKKSSAFVFGYRKREFLIFISIVDSRCIL